MTVIRALTTGLACSLVCGLACVIAGGHALAQGGASEAASYPNRIVRLIVPFPPGGPADVIARFVGQKLSEDWGQTVVVENRPGGNTAIAAQQVARSAPDGYTLFIPMDTTMVLNPLTLPNLPYEPLKDFVPISMLTKNMSLVVTRMAGPKSIKELIDQAKARPGKMNMGAGTITSRLGAVLFAKTAGIDVQLIPFKGSAEIGQAVLAGTVDFALELDRHRAAFGAGRPISRAREIHQPAAAAVSRRAESQRSRRPSFDRRKLDLDRGRRTGWHATSDRRQDPERDRQDLWRQGNPGAAREGRHQRRQFDLGRACRVHPQREHPLGAGAQGKCPSAET